MACRLTWIRSPNATRCGPAGPASVGLRQQAPSRRRNGAERCDLVVFERGAHGLNLCPTRARAREREYPRIDRKVCPSWPRSPARAVSPANARKKRLKSPPRPRAHEQMDLIAADRRREHSNAVTLRQLLENLPDARLGRRALQGPFPPRTRGSEGECRGAGMA